MKIKGYTIRVLAFMMLTVLAACSDDDNGSEELALSFTIETTVNSSANYYQGLTMQIGTSDSEDNLSTATIDANGKAVFSVDLSQYVNQSIWVCVPGMVKFFHILTQAEVENKTLILPDKDKGSTLLTTEGSPVAAGRYYVNDWIVALYMGVNKDGNSDTPLYWATGNLIATKTNAEGSDSNVAFHIATADETIAECKVGAYSDTDDRIVANVADAYSLLPLGTQWDKYCFGDASGKMLYDLVKLEEYMIATKQLQNGNIVYKVSGSECDIARVQLGGSWRTPTGGNDEHNEFAAFEDDSEEYSDRRPDGTDWIEEGVKLGLKYEYVVEVDGKKLTTNILYLPASGFRHVAAGGGRGSTGFYWTGTADPTGLEPWTPNGQFEGKVDEKTTAFNYGFIKGAAKWYPHPRNSCQAIRPVTE